MLLLSSADFFKNYFGNTIRVSNSWDVLSVLTWVQTVCKGNQEMTKIAGAGKELKSTKCALRRARALFRLNTVPVQPACPSVQYVLVSPVELWLPPHHPRCPLCLVVALARQRSCNVAS